MLPARSRARRLVLPRLTAGKERHQIEMLADTPDVCLFARGAKPCLPFL